MPIRYSDADCCGIGTGDSRKRAWMFVNVRGVFVNYICWEATDAITEPSDRVYICLRDFKMPPPIENPADCEVRTVIRFLCAQGFKSVDIHHQISEVYGENIMSDGMVRKWHIHFSKYKCHKKNSLVNVALYHIHHIWHFRVRLREPGQPIGRLRKTCKNAFPRTIPVSFGRLDTPIATESSLDVHFFNFHVNCNSREREQTIHTISSLAEKFPAVSRSVLYEIVSERLNYRKLCSRWVPKMLTDEHKTKRLGSALSFLERYSKEGDDFLSHIVTGDETWVAYVTPESKQQSMEWRHSSTSRKVKFKQTISA
ncbi:HTH_48 domain-containing protein [Trichonephila clavipes]|nr:HTH_48 domain-containing protein [Trichonephila clavipes]